MNRRRFAVLAAALALGCAAGPSPAAPAGKVRVYVGTYTQGDSKGIYHLDLDMATGAMKDAGVTEGIKNPSFLAIHPNRKFLYSVGEIGDFGGKKAGGVSAFAIDPKTGALTALNQQSSEGQGPCHLVVDREGKNVLVANYGGGSVACLPVGADGKLAAAASFVQHTGSSVNPGRQKEPHAHSINVDAANRFAMAADLGLDKVLVYKLDAATGKLTPNDPPSASVAPGSGPRHFAFHPNGKNAYVINEMKLTVTAFAYDAAKGVLTELQTLSTLPEGTAPTGSTAEVQVSPDGKWVFGSNRGHDSIVVYAVGADGKLTWVENEPTGGKTPRNFGVDPTGTYLLAANQGSGTVFSFRIDGKTGKLEPTGHSARVPMPVCVKFLALGD